MYNVDCNVRCLVSRIVVSRRLMEVWDCWWLKLIVGWNVLMCWRKVVREGDPWVQSMKMSSMKRSQMNAKRLLLGN